MESFKPGKPLWSSFFKHFLHNAAAIFQYSIFVQNVGATIFSGGCQWLACLRWLGQQGVSCGLCRIKWWFNWINLNKLRICQKLHLISDMWLQSRTSNSVDRAGLSLRPAPWREPTSRFSSNIMSFGALNHPHNKFPLLTIYHLWRNPTSNCSSNILSSSSLGLFKTHISNKSPLLTIYGISSLQHSQLCHQPFVDLMSPSFQKELLTKAKTMLTLQWFTGDGKAGLPLRAEPGGLQRARGKYGLRWRTHGPGDTNTNADTSTNTNIKKIVYQG